MKLIPDFENKDYLKANQKLIQYQFRLDILEKNKLKSLDDLR